MNLHAIKTGDNITNNIPWIQCRYIGPLYNGVDITEYVAAAGGDGDTVKDEVCRANFVKEGLALLFYHFL